MTNELREAIRGVRNRLDLADRRVGTTADRTNVLEQLTGADYISLGALFVGWASALLFVGGEPNWALLAMFGAFLLDKADGWYARRTGTSSPFGRQVDSFIDIFAYLVPAVLLYHFVLAPHVLASLVVGFLVLAFGGLRLVRHNEEGFGSDGGASYYHGTTVVHTNLLVVANYFVAALVAPWNGWIAGLLVAAACPLMVSDYKAYKTDGTHVLAGLAAVAAVGLALGLEFGYL
ncbi:CDP-alcohol phosphatidyltransferase [Haloterrigena salina JCM 13891]|uniref:CDP-alcohol phosphatidyltransferase n=1 Tax=Haloterrigena salina JCM 13891 TaxID=1227488 RepID=M0C945_9EURY|nr:CDP-alcohol phosphatidyltransferase family protein [Haloterrigena salina]ELZ19796.1 CDP-alcohol phosphatidyltransferase [Haloterrigena salina JCM 13891]